jgi:hypothetical protein
MSLYLEARANCEYIGARLAAAMRRGRLFPLISYAARGSADSALEPFPDDMCLAHHPSSTCSVHLPHCGLPDYEMGRIALYKLEGRDEAIVQLCTGDLH